jgi:hypothetical protein
MRPDEINRLADRWLQDAYRVGMVWRWKSNDQVPPEDVVEAMAARGLVSAFEVAACECARERELAAFVAEYRLTQPPVPSREEQYELEAAFGKGTEVVDVISGRKWTT